MVWWVRWCLLLSVIVAGRVMAKRPNVIFIIVDDSEFIEYGCYGGRTLTPHIDSLAQNGVLFTHGFTSRSVCTPTRYACLSGQYASRAQSLAQRDQQPDHMSRFVRWNTDMDGSYAPQVFNQAALVPPRMPRGDFSAWAFLIVAAVHF